MADSKKAVSENAPGEFFVDSTCINCDTCRQLAPAQFEDAGNYSFVHTQPHGPKEIHSATLALLACPTGSIGTLHANDSSERMKEFPLPIEEDVFYCGFNSPKSFGGNSYFIRHREGNWLVDSPKYLPYLVRWFEQAGGISRIFLTHRDDVAEAAKYAEKFKSRRIIHERDQGAQRGAEMILQGDEISPPGRGFLHHPHPRSYRGPLCTFVPWKVSFHPGDHLWWRRKRKQLGASQGVAWYSWAETNRIDGKIVAV